MGSGGGCVVQKHCCLLCCSKALLPQSSSIRWGVKRYGIGSAQVLEYLLLRCSEVLVLVIGTPRTMSAAAATLPFPAAAAACAGRTPTRTRTPTRATTRCQAAAGQPARVRIFKGGSKEVLFGAKQNLLGCLEKEDDAGVEAAISELSGLTPTARPGT